MAWLVGTGCSLRGTDDLTAGRAADDAPPSPSSDDPPDEEPPPTCGPGRATCGGDCVDITENEDHCGACNAPCATGGCEQGSCIRVEANFQGNAIVADAADRFYISESHLCQHRLLSFKDEQTPSPPAPFLPPPGVVLVDGVTVDDRSQVFFTGLANAPQRPLVMYHYNPDTDELSDEWTESLPLARNLEQPIQKPIAAGSTALAWATETGFLARARDGGGGGAGGGGAARRGIGTDKLSGGALDGAEPVAAQYWNAPNTEALVWSDGEGLFRMREPIPSASGPISDFNLAVDSLVWAEGDGDIRLIADLADDGAASTLATSETVGRIALGLQHVYWVAPVAGGGGVLKRVLRTGGAVETLHTDPDWAFDALTTTSNHVYWTASRVGSVCQGRVYRRRLNTPALP